MKIENLFEWELLYLFTCVFTRKFMKHSCCESVKHEEMPRENTKRILFDKRFLSIVPKYALIGRIGKLNTFLLDLENLVDLQSTPDLSKKVEAIKEVLDMCNLPASNLNIQSWVSFNFSTPPAFPSLTLWFEVNSEMTILYLWLCGFLKCTYMIKNTFDNFQF